jgi:hypothetical protein
VSNRRKRKATRSYKTPAERWRADRYRPHRQYTAAQVRRILVDDSAARLDIPLSWFVAGIQYIAAKERKTNEDVTIEIREACIEQCGLDLPITGLTL